MGPRHEGMSKTQFFMNGQADSSRFPAGRPGRNKGPVAFPVLQVPVFSRDFNGPAEEGLEFPRFRLSLST